MDSGVQIVSATQENETIPHARWDIDALNSVSVTVPPSLALGHHMNLISPSAAAFILREAGSTGNICWCPHHCQELRRHLWNHAPAFSLREGM
jgi:hypothetical protein